MSPKLPPRTASDQTSSIADSSAVFNKPAQSISFCSNRMSVDLSMPSTSWNVLESHSSSTLYHAIERLVPIAPATSKMISQFSLDAGPLHVQPNSITNHPSLSTLPCELRDMIFKDCIELVDGKTPTLMIALRCNKELYPHALELYYKINFFTLNEFTKGTLKKVSPTAIANIRNLCIE